MQNIQTKRHEEQLALRDAYHQQLLEELMARHAREAMTRPEGFVPMSSIAA